MGQLDACVMLGAGGPASSMDSKFGWTPSCHASARYIHITVNGSDALWFANRVARENMDAGAAGFSVEVFGGLSAFLQMLRPVVQPATSHAQDRKPTRNMHLHVEVVTCQNPQ